MLSNLFTTGSSHQTHLWKHLFHLLTLKTFSCKQQFGSTRILAFQMYWDKVTTAAYNNHVKGNRVRVEVEGLMTPRYGEDWRVYWCPGETPKSILELEAFWSRCFSGITRAIHLSSILKSQQVCYAPWTLQAEHRLYGASGDRHFNIQASFSLFVF